MRILTNTKNPNFNAKSFLYASTAITAILGTQALTHAEEVKADTTTNDQQNETIDGQKLHVSRASDLYEAPNESKNEVTSNSDSESSTASSQNNTDNKNSTSSQKRTDSDATSANATERKGLDSSSVTTNTDDYQKATKSVTSDSNTSSSKETTKSANSTRSNAKTSSSTSGNYNFEPLQDPGYNGEQVEKVLHPDDIMKTVAVLPNVTKTVTVQTNNTELIDSNNAASTKDTELEAPLATYPPVSRVDGLYSGSRTYTLYIPGSSSVTINGVDMWTNDNKVRTGWDSSLVQKVPGTKDLYTVGTTIPNTIEYISSPENVGKFVNFKVSYINTAGGRTYESSTYSQRLDSKLVYETKNNAKNNVDSQPYLSSSEKENLKSKIQAIEAINNGLYDEKQTINNIDSLIKKSELTNVVNEINTKNISIDEIQKSLTK